MMKKNYSCWVAVGISCIYLLLLGYLYGVKALRRETLHDLRSGDDEKLSTETQPVQPFEMFAYTPPADWTKYMVGDDFYISVPPTVELRKSDDLYTQRVRNTDWHGYKINISTPVFQQKDLAVMDSAAFQTYCRIILDIERGSPGDFLKSSESMDLTAEDIHTLQEKAVAGEVDTEFKAITTPTVRWVKIENLYGIRVEYIRKGTGRNYTHVFHYLFFNDDKMAHVILSYRVRDAHRWKMDFDNVIRTFKWKI